MIYFTADTHFGHANIIKHESRPFTNVTEMDAQMIKNWNSKITSEDDVYILGDFTFSKGAIANNILSQLNGRKYLIKGNHDYFLKDRDFDRSLLVWVRDYYVLRYNSRKFVLFHYPIQVWDCRHHNAIHLYGHIHSNISDHAMEYNIPNSYNVGVDVNNFTPISIDEIIKKWINNCEGGVKEHETNNSSGN